MDMGCVTGKIEGIEIRVPLKKLKYGDSTNPLLMKKRLL